MIRREEKLMSKIIFDGEKNRINWESYYRK